MRLRSGSIFQFALLSIQFPYRLLMFATTFGTIAAGLVLTAVAAAIRVSSLRYILRGALPSFCKLLVAR